MMEYQALLKVYFQIKFSNLRYAQDILDYYQKIKSMRTFIQYTYYEYACMCKPRISNGNGTHMLFVAIWADG